MGLGGEKLDAPRGTSGFAPVNRFRREARESISISISISIETNRNQAMPPRADAAADGRDIGTAPDGVEQEFRSFLTAGAYFLRISPTPWLTQVES
jgi:hypothetical protein